MEKFLRNSNFFLEFYCAGKINWVSLSYMHTFWLQVLCEKKTLGPVNQKVIGDVFEYNGLAEDSTEMKVFTALVLSLVWSRHCL